MTKEQYLMMCEQTGEEIDWDRCPPEPEDFPSSVITALNIFNSLGNKVYGDVGYTGKDFTNIDLILEVYKVTSYLERSWILELLLFMDSIAIEENNQRLKEAHAKIKKK
tara:strand:- start:435 stop:761 length:327 start_codon:yes stop_codon:yes gene_type:complete